MENTQGMTADELAAQMPLEEYIPISEAAKILGGGVVRVKSLMELVMTGGLFSWSHSCPHHAPSRQIYHKINLEIELPNLTPETDPSTVLVASKDVLWRWCAEIEGLLQEVDDEHLPLRERVSTRLRSLQDRAYQLKTGTRPGSSAGLVTHRPAGSFLGEKAPGDSTSNLKFYEAVLRDELPISKEWADKGWPPLLYPWFLACAQLPDADEPAKRAFTLAMGDSIKAGVLPAERLRIPWFVEQDITEPHVSGSNFATWLQAQGMEPSPLVREWIEGQGVGSAPVLEAVAPESPEATVGAWPWGSHHTAALGHLEAAARRFWVNHDPADFSTAPKNTEVSDWLQRERNVTANMANAIASILRMDGLPTGPRK